MKLFIGNLNRNTQEAELKKLFAEVAEPVSVKIIMDRDTGQSRCFGFAEFESTDIAKQIIEKFNGYELDGFQIKLDEAKEKSAKPRRSNW